VRITAAVLRDKAGEHVLEPVELADPGPDEVLVRISGVGLCHTDLLPRVPAYPAPLPLIAGHEGSGVVTEVGAAVTGIAVGDHVIASFDSCGGCANCLAGHPAYCVTFAARNMSGRALDGSTVARDASGAEVSARWFGQSSFASHALVAANNLVVVDAELPLEVLGPLGCGVQTGAASVFTALGVRAGESIVVFGVGAVGLSAVMAARVAGATTIVAVDRLESRLALAEELGATHALPADADLVGEIHRITNGGAQYTLDTTGMSEVIGAAVNALRVTGTCGLLGVPQGEPALDPRGLAFGKTVTGIIEGDAVPRRTIPALIELWRQGRFPFDRLVSTFPLDRINEAEQAMTRGDVVKPVLVPAV
jgi:aryl-alcohol dehydrogenase